ncbi:unnamed protein product [Sphenostylis stenocarpa]|uniref:BRX domain-containing protein n=1 Tax=Sphenostylis stenocarpa TaxID=92480 RepID=A0AA86SC87_9FABA|nr:unnamed protein product [Sphenostylis stenocarpa]
MQDVEIKKLKQKATEASALAAVESSNHRVTKEFVESTIHQMKEMTDKLPGEITESKNLRSVLNRVKNFLQETSEFETSSSPKLETKQKDEHDRPTSNSDSYSKLQIYRVEENVDANLSHDKENFLEERNKPSTDTCKDRGNSLKESDEPNSEIEYKNAPRTFSSTSDGSEMLDDRLEENAEVAIVDQSEEAEEDVFQECIGSRSRIDRTPSSENSNNGSRSLDSSRLGKQGEEQIIEKFDCGVYVMLVLQSDGAKIFKRVKFR